MAELIISIAPPISAKFSKNKQYDDFKYVEYSEILIAPASLIA